jgi:hypothetical protein
MASTAGSASLELATPRTILIVDDHIALTGGAAGLNSLRSQWAGFDCHLTKPIGMDELLASVSATRHSGTFTRETKTELLFRGPKPRRHRERARIDLHESREVARYWTTELCCTEAELRAAVEEVGVSSEQVRRRLKR